MEDTALDIATALIAGFEGFKSHPYLDGSNVWTVGFGFTYLANGQKVTQNTPPVTEEDSKIRLKYIVSKTLTNVRSMVYTPINDNQAAALASLAFNIGTNALRSSTLLKLLNQGDIRGAANQFAAWVYDHGGVVEGLRKRRLKEQALFLSVEHDEPDESTTDDLNELELQRLLNSIGDDS